MLRRFLIFALLLVPILALGQTRQTIKVATRLIDPFVIDDNGRLTGFSIDLWKALADQMDVKTAYETAPDVQALLGLVKSGKADVGISAVSITAERDKDFDFSQPMFDAGLQIMVKDKGTEGPFDRIKTEIITSGILRWLAYIFVFGLIPAHIVWLVERLHPQGLLRHTKYFPGIFEAYWWSLACLATQAEEMPKTAIGRAVAVLWMFTAVIFVAYFTAQVTTSMTVEQLQGVIKGPEDLAGKVVATTTGSTSAAYMRQHGAKIKEFDQIQNAYDALESDQADAVVFDSPVLMYFTTHDGKGRFHLVGDVFRKEDYGIVFRPDSPMRKPVETALLQIKENGTYQEIFNKWFASAGP